MPNIILPQQSLVNALREAPAEAPIVDHNGKPISAREVSDELVDHNKRNFKFLMPVGAGWRFYKIKNPHTDKWLVGYVKDRPIPKGSTAILPRTAFEMMYGVKLADSNTAKNNWMKIKDDTQGYVTVAMEEKPDINFANMNDPKQSEKVIQQSQIFKP